MQTSLICIDYHLIVIRKQRSHTVWCSAFIARISFLRYNQQMGDVTFETETFYNNDLPTGRSPIKIANKNSEDGIYR